MSESDARSPAPDTKQSGGELASHDRPARQARTRSMVLIGMAIVGLFLILLVAGILPRIRNQRELAAAAQKVQSALPQVYVIRPQPAAEAGLSLAATTQAIQDSIIYARTSGYLRKRYVDIGDRVTAGQLLAEVDSPEIEQQLRQAKADLQQSERNRDLQKANLDLAKVTMARYEAADAEGAVAKQALDQSVSTYRTAQAAVAAAEANVESNRANVQRLQEMTSFQRVLAPFNGTVIQRNVDVGALITAGSPVNNTAVAPSSVAGGASGLFEIAQIDTLRVFVNVPQVYAATLKVARGRSWPRSTSPTQRTGCLRECSSTSPSRSAPPARTGGSRPPRSSSTRKAPAWRSWERETSCIFKTWCSAETSGPRSTSRPDCRAMKPS